MLKSILLVAVTLLAPAIVLAGTYYRYTTDSGSTAFADKLDRVPERYRDSATEVPAQSIFDYPRTTVTEKPAPTPEAAQPAPTAQPVIQLPGYPGATADSGIVLELQPGIRVRVPEQDDDKPLRVHRRFYNDGIGDFTRTQITHDGKVLVELTEDREPYVKWDGDDVEMPNEGERDDD